MGLPLETEFHYPFDFTLYTPDEIATLIQAVHVFEAASLKQIYPADLPKWIQTYKEIIANKAEEKRLDQIFKKELGFSVYELNKKSA